MKNVIYYKNLNVNYFIIFISKFFTFLYIINFKIIYYIYFKHKQFINANFNFLYFKKISIEKNCNV